MLHHAHRHACLGRDVELAYQLVHNTPGSPMLLVCGNFTQMIQWPDELLDGLAARGFQAAMFDNRDSGRSTHCDDLPRYTLREMANDATAVLDALGWSSAHILGPSLGGMIGQAMAVHHPDRVRSLTTISAPPAWKLRVMRPRLRTVLKVLAIASKPSKTRQAAIEQAVRMFPLMTTPQYPIDEQRLRELTGRAYDIADDSKGGMRQQTACKLSGDRRSELKQITAPTLVVHGEQDPMTPGSVAAVWAQTSTSSVTDAPSRSISTAHCSVFAPPFPRWPRPGAARS